MRADRGGGALHGEQVLQLVGALLILAAFVLAQLGRLTTASYPYLVLNLVGSALLAVLAWLAQQWGFLLLEAVWAVVSAGSLFARLTSRDVATTR